MPLLILLRLLIAAKVEEWGFSSNDWRRVGLLDLSLTTLAPWFLFLVVPLALFPSTPAAAGSAAVGWIPLAVWVLIRDRSKHE